MTYENDYYYGNEQGNLLFFKLPQAFFDNEKYEKLSDSAKILYSLMLDRMGLSQKNGWFDENNRVYIYFTLDDIRKHMKCGQDKCIKLLAELDSIKGFGLIERIKQGQGKPAKIYVKKCAGSTPSTPTDGDKENQDFEKNTSEIMTSENQNSLTGTIQSIIIENDRKIVTSENQNIEENTVQRIESKSISDISVQKSEESRNPEKEIPAFRNTEVQTSDMNKSELPDCSGCRPRQSGSLDVGISDTNHIEFNKTEFNNTNTESIQSIYQQKTRVEPSHNEVQKEIDEIDGYRNIIRENISYDCLIEQYNYSESEIDSLVSVMIDSVTTKKPYLSVNSESKPTALVKSTLLKLGFEHIDYVMTSMKKNTTKVRNIRAYLLTTLYNSYSTMDAYYTAWVNHDMHTARVV